MSERNLEKAYQIAKKELRSCYDELGIVSGRGHYGDYWTIDGAFGSFGALALGDYEIVKKELDLLASFQRRDGMIPFLVRKIFPLLPFLGIKIKIKPRAKFRSHKILYLSDVITSNPWFVIIFSRLLEKTKDGRLLERYENNIEMALSWCLKKMKPGTFLAREGPIANWNDGVYKTGKTLMTNVIFYKAFKDWEDICFKYFLELKPEFRFVAERIKEAIQREFWNGQYFIDWIDWKKHHYFDSNANFLAILYGIANREQAEKTVGFVLEKLIDRPFVKLAYPSYPFYRIEILNSLLGLADYASGDGMYWVEPICLFILCLKKINREKLANEFLINLAEKVVEYGGIYEVYEKDKKSPVRRFNYRAEFPFARSSALFIAAVKGAF